LQRALLAWQTQTISAFVAATVPVAKGKKNALLDSARKISLDGTTEEKATKKASAPKEPQLGSYERLMGMSGQMQ
jgi:hypothetical protein